MRAAAAAALPQTYEEATGKTSSANKEAFRAAMVRRSLPLSFARAALPCIEDVRCSMCCWDAAMAAGGNRLVSSTAGAGRCQQPLR